MARYQRYHMHFEEADTIIRVDEFCTHFALTSNHPLASAFAGSNLLLVPSGIAAASTLANSVSHQFERDSDADLAREYLLERNFHSSELSVTSFTLLVEDVQMEQWGHCGAELVSKINAVWQATCQQHGARNLPNELSFASSFHDGHSRLPIRIRVKEPIPLPFPRQLHGLALHRLGSSSAVVPTSAIFFADQISQLDRIVTAISTIQSRVVANRHNRALLSRLEQDEEAYKQARSKVLLSMALYIASMFESGLVKDLKFRERDWLRTYCGSDRVGSQLFGAREAVDRNGRFLVAHQSEFPTWFRDAVDWWVPGEIGEARMRRAVLTRVLESMRDKLFAIFHDVVSL